MKVATILIAFSVFQLVLGVRTYQRNGGHMSRASMTHFGVALVLFIIALVTGMN